MIKAFLIAILCSASWAQTKVDYPTQLKRSPYYDLRQSGAVCDGTTNVQPAVTAAMGLGYRRLFLGANCFWNPTGNLIPDGISVMGEDGYTSKIWPTNPASNFLTIGKSVTMQNVNTNGPGCNQQSVGLGCPVGVYTNTDPNNRRLVANFPGNSIFADVGDTAATGGNPHDTNGIVVIQHGDGGGIYGQFVGDVDLGAGSGIHADQVSNSALGAGLRVTKRGSGTGTVFDEAVGGETGTTIQWASSLKTSGDVFNFFHSTSSWGGDLLSANLGFSGSFTGHFLIFRNNGTTKSFIDSTGNLYHAGYESIDVGANVSSASSITPTGPMFHVTGSAAISTINIPSGLGASAHCMRIIADAAPTTTTGGNISAAISLATGRVTQMCYDPGTSKYYPN